MRPNPGALRIPLFLVLLASLPSGASAGRYIPGNATRVGARNAGMGGGHAALSGELSQVLVNPAGILLDENATLFAFEGLVTDGPEFETRGGRNRVRADEANPPLLMGLTTTYADNFAFAVFDALRYNAHFSGSLFSLDDPALAIADYEEETRLNATGIVAAVRPRPDLSVGLGLYLDRQKVFKSLDFAPNDTIPFLDFEVFGTANALHGALGILWTPRRGRTTLGLAFHSSPNLANNVTKHTFRIGFIDSSNTNGFFEQSDPVSDDAFPWSVAAGAHHRLAYDKDLFADLAYVGWDVEANRKGQFALSVGGEWRAWRNGALRAGLYSQLDPSEYDTRAGFTEEDAYLLDLRSATASATADKNDEVFLTAGVGLQFGAFAFDAAVEDSHLLSDYGRTVVKAGISGRLQGR